MYIDIKNEKIIGIYADNERKELIDVGIIPSPEEIPGKIPVMYYRNGAIVYEYEEAPEATEDGTETPPVPMDYGETVKGLIRRKYTLSEELAILRQRDTKAEEFEVYNAYAESCKEEARLLIEKQKHWYGRGKRGYGGSQRDKRTGVLGADRSILLGVVGHDDGGLLQVVQIDYHQEHGGLRRILERAYRKDERPG